MKFITGKQFKGIISLPDTILRNDLKIPEDNRNFYLLNDGRLLAFSDSIPNRVQMFASVDEYNKIIAIIRSDVEEGPILEKYIEIIDRIPGCIDTCKEILCKELNLKPELLDFSPTSISLIDQKIKTAITRQAYFDSVYIHLLVYFGEAVRKLVNGEWGKKIQEGVVEPFILSEGNQELFFSKELHEQAAEDFNKFSVYREFNIVTNGG